MSPRAYIWRSRLIILLASLLILTALIFGVLRLLLPHVTDYGDKIRMQLAKQLGIPVSIKTVNAEIWWLSPRLKLTDVGIFDADNTRQLLHVNEILVGFDWLASIRQRHLQLGFISFNGMQLQIRHRVDGSWQIQNLLLPAPGDGPLQLPPQIVNLLQDTSIYLHDIQLDWHDEQRNNQHLRITDLNISLLNDAPHHEIAIDLELPQNYGGHVRVLAQLNGPINQPAQWQGRLYTAVERLQLKPWFNDYWQLFDFTADGQLDASVWIDWQQLQIQQIHSYINGERLALHYLHQDVNSWKLKQLIGNLRWQVNEQGWQADVSGLEIHREHAHWRQPSAASLVMDTQQQQFKLRANYLQVDDLVYLAGLGNSFLRQTNQDWNTPLQAWQPQGELFDVDLQLSLDAPEDTPGLTAFSSRFVDASFTSQQSGLPSVSGLDGRVTYQYPQARILLDSQQVTLDFKDLFRQPLQLQTIKTDLFVRHDTNRTELYAADITAVSPHIFTRSRVHVVANKNAPVFMDLVTTYDHGQGAYTSRYLPAGIMGKDTVEWLDQALVVATISQGGFLFYGQLPDFPFDNNQGVMLAQFDVSQAQLKYQPDWPQIDKLAARVRFRNNAMLIDQGQGTIFGAKLANTTVSIEKLDEPLLVIKGDVAGPLPDLVQFVGASPLKEPLAFVSSLQTTGNVNLGLDLEIPLSGDSQQVLVKGELAFTGNELFLPDTGYRFKGVNGVLHFTEASLEAEQIRASLDSYPLSLRIDPMDIDGINHSRIAIQGFIPLTSLLAPIPDWKNKVAGGSDWQVTLDIPMQDRPDGVDLAVAAMGDMQGVSSQLPLFLAKPAQQPGTMRFGLDVLANGDMNIRAALSDSYQASAERRQQRWSVEADSAMLRGKASFMEDFTLDKLMSVDLERLDMAALQAAMPATDDASSQVKPPAKPEDDVLPTQIPPLKVHIAQLDWNKVQLRDVNLQTHRTKAGMEIDSLKLSGPHVTVEGRGSWQTAWRAPHITRFDFTVKAENLGATLAEMGHTQNLENTEGVATFRWRWQDAPQNFDWAKLTGDADIHFKNGRLQQVEAGAGRLLGILNFRTLLSLDFGGQVREGFAFDKISAHHTFANGNAYSDDFKIESKVAVINMQGRIGLVKEDYDQTITVVPVVGNTLTLIGTVAGGPVTGVLVHVFQKLLGVDKLAGYKYTVKGSWEQPKVTLLDAPPAANNESTEP